MIRKTLTILSVIGLLLSVGAWGISCLVIEYSTTCNAWTLSLGCAFWFHWPPAFHDPSYMATRQQHLGLTCHGFNGFHTIWSPEVIHIPSMLRIRLPLWIPVVFFGLMVGITYAPIRRRRKRKKLGLCVKCGYDLRASKGRCPECGEAFANDFADGSQKDLRL